jgi:hypothetical protein
MFVRPFIIKLAMQGISCRKHHTTMEQKESVLLERNTVLKTEKKKLRREKRQLEKLVDDLNNHVIDSGEDDGPRDQSRRDLWNALCLTHLVMNYADDTTQRALQHVKGLLYDLCMTCECNAEEFGYPEHEAMIVAELFGKQ